MPGSRCASARCPICPHANWADRPLLRVLCYPPMSGFLCLGGAQCHATAEAFFGSPFLPLLSSCDIRFLGSSNKEGCLYGRPQTIRERSCARSGIGAPIERNRK